MFLTIGGMVLHNGLFLLVKMAARRGDGSTMVWFTASQRLQHWLLLTSFIVLVLSGFALQYPDSWLAWLLGSNEYLRRGLHRFAAVVMLVVGVYHLGYLAFTKDGRRWVKDMLPSVKDLKDVFGNFAYYLGLRSIKPKIARFGYAEK